MSTTPEAKMLCDKCGHNITGTAFGEAGVNGIKVWHPHCKPSAPQPPAGEPAVVEALRAALYRMTGAGKHVSDKECEEMVRAALQQLEQAATGSTGR